MAIQSKSRCSGIQSFLAIVLFSGVIPAALIGLGVLFHDWEGTVRFWLESLGMYLAGMALFFAEKAAKRSKQTEDRLIKYGLDTSENRNEFPAIFHEHLLAPFASFNGNGGTIYLLLSTPAYGYAVVGPETFGEFVDLLASVPATKLEFIFFPPDDHFHYWANVLLWSEVRSRQFPKTLFSEGFAAGITHVFQKIEGRGAGVPTRVWVTRATTVRVFAFFPKAPQAASPDDVPPDCVYVALTDPFSLSQDQFKAGFQARSIRIPSFAAQEYAGDPSSYFERAKVCPYMGTSRDRAALDPAVHNERLYRLRADYVLGRTQQVTLSRDSFRAEVQALLNSESLREMKPTLENEQVLLCILKRVVEYYNSSAVLGSSMFVGTLSSGHRVKLASALEACTTLPQANQELKDAIAKLLAMILPLTPKGAAVIEQAYQQPHSALPYSQSAEHLSSATTNVHGDAVPDIISCLYSIMCSGFGESEYARSLVD